MAYRANEIGGPLTLEQYEALPEEEGWRAAPTQCEFPTSRLSRKRADRPTVPRLMAAGTIPGRGDRLAQLHIDRTSKQRRTTWPRAHMRCGSSIRSRTRTPRITPGLTSVSTLPATNRQMRMFCRVFA